MSFLYFYAIAETWGVSPKRHSTFNFFAKKYIMCLLAKMFLKIIRRGESPSSENFSHAYLKLKLRLCYTRSCTVVHVSQ